MQVAAPDGHSTREHLEALVRRGKAIPVELEGPDFPEELAYLWDWFMELSSTRRVGMGGLEALTFPDLDAWARLTDRHPSPLEVRAILDLDIATRSAMAEARRDA